MSLLSYTFTYILVALLLFTSNTEASNGRQLPTSLDTSATSNNTSLQQSSTADKRIIHIETSSIYDINISLSQFIVCLPNIGSTNLVFSVQSCHDARLLLLTEKGLNDFVYEIVIGGRKNLSYIQKIETDGSFIVSNISYDIFVSCNEYINFKVSWEQNSILLKNEYGKEISMKNQHETLTYASVTTGFGATGRWEIEPEEQVLVDPVKFTVNTIQRSSLGLCPLASECMSSDKNQLVYNSHLRCQKNTNNGVPSISLTFKCSDLCGIKCMKEFLQMTVCTTSNQDCTECNITNYQYNVNSSCQNPQNVGIKVMDVSSCDFPNNMKMYFRFIHYKSTDDGRRTVFVPTPANYDYLVSLLRFHICLRSLKDRKITFHVKSCHDTRLALFVKTELKGSIYEIVIGRYYSYIQKKTPDKNHIESKELVNTSANCENFRKFWFSWANNTVRLSNYKDTIQTGKINNTDFTHATVTSWSEFGDAEWKFTHQDEGMRQPVTVHLETDTTESLDLMLCPFETECGLNMKNHSTCSPILTDINVACENSKVNISFKCNKEVANACTRESIQLVGCTSHVQNRCRTCNITDNTYAASSLCNHNYSRNHIEVMKVNTCKFFEINGWKIYFRYLHIYKTDHGNATTAMPSSSTSTLDKTSTKTTPTSASIISSTMASSALPTLKTSITTPQSPTSTTVSEKSTSLNIFADTGQKSSTPLTIGIAVGVTGLFLAVICVIILLIFIRRSKSAGYKQGSNTKVSKGDDYTGNQSIALPSACNQYSDIQHELEEQHYQELTIINKCDKEIAYDYIDTSDVIHKSESKASMNNKQPGYERQFDDMSDNQSIVTENTYSVLDQQETGFNCSQELPQSKTETEVTETEIGSSYAVLDPTVTGFDRSEISTVKPAETYTILDPNETDFNRMETTNQSEYEMAKPLTDDGIKENSEQPYSSEYNKLGDPVSEKMMDSVYSHSVDNVYDSASHNKKPNISDDNYDHFIGQ